MQINGTLILLYFKELTEGHSDRPPSFEIVHEQVLRSLAPSKTIECIVSTFVGNTFSAGPVQNGRPCLIASNMATPWQKAI